MEMSGHLSPGGDVRSPLSWWRCLVTSLLVEMSGHLSPGGDSPGGDVWSPLSWWRCQVISLLVEMSGHLSPGGDSSGGSDQFTPLLVGSHSTGFCLCLSVLFLSL